MKRRLAVLVVGISACMVYCFIRLSGEAHADEGEDRIHSPSWSEMREIQLCTRDLEDEALQVKLFRERLAEVKADLKSGGNLETAARAIVAEAHERNPKFLIGLNKRFPHMPEIAAAAANLVEDITWQGGHGFLTNAQLARVDDLWRNLVRIPGVEDETLCKLMGDLPEQRLAARPPSRPSAAPRNPGKKILTVASSCIHATGMR